ncbi:MAG: DUF1592 domain-containing protein [Bryobacterales bacterium]|nr:DUF1592 domain-containing protein [Bryobacterales bacterium]
MFLPLLVATLVSISAMSLHAASSDVFAYVEKSCAGCHNGSVKSGDIDLKSLHSAKTFDEDREIWEKVVEKLKLGQMPPPGIPKPEWKATKAVTEWLEGEFARQDRTAKPDPGRVTARRLNRAEYNNTIRDLLGIDIRPADNFPADTPAFGFDNISDALGLSPALLENYIDAAERSVRAALFGPEKRKPAAVHYSAPVRINDSRGTRSLPKDLSRYDETGLSTLHSAHFVHRFPVDAEYNFRLVLNGHRPNQSEPARPALYIDGKFIKEWEVDATDLEGQIVEVRARVTAGEHLLSATYHKNYHGLPPQYGGPDPSKRPPEALINPRGKLSEKDIETLRKYGTRIKTDGIETRIDNRYEAIDIGGPFEQTMGAPAESLKRIFVCGHTTGKHVDACARKVVSHFASRAYRRPATAKEVDQALGFLLLARKQGDSFEEGIATALQSILVSPQFLYRIEREPSAVAGRNAVPVNAYELASRLSYFLWSSTPDEELLRLAGEGKLRQPAVLEAQVKRMLRDGRSSALVENFAGQWLQFKNIDVVRPDPQKFPMFDDALRLAMRRETELFLEHIVREDRSVLDLLDANYTFVNERLARFYGIDGVTGPEFRKVDVSGTNRGGGVLAHASVLTVSSYSTRTSPVIRGKWIMENLLNAPPPAPPPGVPPLDEAKAGGGTLRQQMEEHRKNPACASCHSRLDPLGFSLENYDAIGKFRAQEGGAEIDASGSMPNGSIVRGPGDLKKILLERQDDFVECLAEKMLTYSIGRGLQHFDLPAVRQIRRETAENGYRFSALTLAIVNSVPFQMRRTPDK